MWAKGPGKYLLGRLSEELLHLLACICSAAHVCCSSYFITTAGETLTDQIAQDKQALHLM